MGLSDIAAGIEVVHEQRDCGVATVDRTDGDLQSRLEPFSDALPCDVDAAAALVEAYATGRSVGDAARAAGLAPMDGAKTLHLLGERVTPLGPTRRDVVRDWLAGECSRADAVALTGATDAEFALAAFVETHDPVPEAREAVEGVLTTSADATVAKRDALGETMSDVDDLV
ncbi:MAG: hypothetical protein ABEI96_11355 [Haloarculaceae archaeon]